MNLPLLLQARVPFIQRLSFCAHGRFICDLQLAQTVCGMSSVHAHCCLHSSALSRGVADHCFRTHQYVYRRQLRHGNVCNRHTRRQHTCCSAEPDWDAEMSMFRKRSMKPNQMQTVRRLEEEVDIGKVIDSYICARTTSVLQAISNVTVV